jgi:hypothetical protein
MSDLEPVVDGTNPAHRVLAVLGTFIGTAAVSALLWNWWSARCGDDCPQPSIVHMLVFLALLPTMGTMAAVLLVSIKASAAFKWRLAAAFLLVAVVVGALVARVPGA